MLSLYVFLEATEVNSEIRFLLFFFFFPNARHYKEKCGALYMVVFVRQLSKTEVLDSSR